MNILFLIDSLSGGGAEKVASILVSRISQLTNNKVYIVVDELYGNEYKIDERVKLISLERKHSKNPCVNIYQKIRKLFKILDIKRKYKINCSISMLPIANFYNVISKRKEKCIVSVRVQMSEGNYPTYINWMNTVASKYADKLVAVSDCVRKDQIKNYGALEEKTVTIYNPCELEKISMLKQEKDIDERILAAKTAGKKILITHGRLTNQKGQWHLIRAMSELIKCDSAIFLVIMGQGELKDYLNHLITQYNLEDYVYMAGFQKNPYKYLELADIYVFTSLYEGFPNALLDAMAVGLPIISTDGVSGIRELLAPKTNCELSAKYLELEEYGVLIPRLNDVLYEVDNKLDKCEEILVTAIKKILENEELRKHYCKKSLERVRDYECNYIVEQWMKNIQQ